MLIIYFAGVFGPLSLIITIVNTLLHAGVCQSSTD